VIAKIGDLSILAFATPVVRFVAPGPRVERHTPTLPVNLPYISAIKAAACSCRTRINLIDWELANEIIRSAFSSPGNPKMNFIFSASKHFIKRSDAFMVNGQDS
ncbi:MAG: hypothetical protein WA631_00740, partial [Nitrososphaeraceae archaeon]